MSADLLFEIGCEEIPAKMLAKQLEDLPKLVEQRLAAARLEHKGVRVLGTPRRLAMIVKGLADRQPDLNEEVVGPPIAIAFAPDGTLTKAGQAFATKNGVAPEAVQKKEVVGQKGKPGVYAVAQRNVVGQDTRGLLPALLADVAGAIAWPKSQRWGWTETTFVRPVQWLVALFGGEVLPLSWANLTAGRLTRGHRFLANTTIEIASADAYVEALRAAHVVVDPDARKDLVRAELSRLENETGLRVRPDDALLGEVIHLGEYPVGVSGEFDPSYLEIPEEIIVTSMRTHQRYFAMENATTHRLANRFATMMATIVKDPKIVQEGNQKVIASRLSDGKFFVSEDRKKKSFDAWNTKLDAVVFQAKLGNDAKTIGHKVRRLEKIAAALATFAHEDVELAKHAARVCKADLASLAVGEFPELQGVMGRHYATDFGEPLAVATAIDEHWWPKGQGAALPSTATGAILALADRMDTIVGCFAVGLEPSGSADPFGLRRAAIGIWQILLARPEWSSLWTPLFASAASALQEQGVKVVPAPWLVEGRSRTRDENAKDAIEDFFRGRLRGILIDGGLPAQDVDAALAQDFRDPTDARARALACAKISKDARQVFKRVANILDDARAKKIEIGAAPLPTLFVADVERSLYSAVTDAQAREKPLRDARDYLAVFDSLEKLRPIVAQFFDKGGVMVMDPDHKLRDNRLALLNWFIDPYLRIADFRLLAGAS